MVTNSASATNRIYTNQRMTYAWLLLCSFCLVSMFKHFHLGNLIPSPLARAREPLGRIPVDGEWYDLLCPRYRLQKMAIPSQLKWRPPNEDTIIFTQTSCGLNFNGRQILTNLHNVAFSLLDLDELFLDSPLQHWYQGRLWLINEEHQSVFMSDASRAEILRKYGGTYMDMDFLTLRPLPNRTNYLGRIDNETITGAIMSLVKGHPLSQILAKSVPEAFDPFQANSIGPSLVTSALRELCPGSLTSNTYSRRLSNASNDEEVSAYLEDISPYFQTPEICSNLIIFPEKMFYPIGFHFYTGERSLLFSRGHGYGEKFLRISKAYSLHLYNSLTWMEELTPGGDSIIEEAMKRNCPWVYHYIEETDGRL